MIKIFKFGGASVKDAEGIRNLALVIETTREKKLLVVVSAMGKMTNSLEGVVSNYFSNREDLDTSVSEIYNFHHKIISEVFNNVSHPVFGQIQKLFKDLSYFLKTSKSKNHAFIYDQVVGFGELASTTIISAYLSEIKIENKFLDVRTCIKTDDNYRDANVDWELTQKNILSFVNPNEITITKVF